MKTFFSKLLAFFNGWVGTIIFVLLFIFFVAQAFVIPSGSMERTLLVGDFLFVKKFSYGVAQPRIPWIEVPVLPDFDGDGHIITGDGPARGDIVVFRNPTSSQGDYYVKRTFAVGGDEVIFAPKAMFLRAGEGDDFMRATFAADKLVVLNGALWVREPYDFAGINYDAAEFKDNFGGRVDIDTFALAVMAFQQGRFAMSPVWVAEFGGDAQFANAFYFKVPAGEYFMVGDNRENSNDSRFWGSIGYKLVVGQPWFTYLSLGKNYTIRWERMFKFIDTLQGERFAGAAAKNNAGAAGAGGAGGVSGAAQNGANSNLR